MGLAYFLKASLRIPCLAINLFNCLVLMPASLAARLTLPLVRENNSLRYWRSKSSTAICLASANVMDVSIGSRAAGESVSKSSAGKFSGVRIWLVSRM